MFFMFLFAAKNLFSISIWVIKITIIKRKKKIKEIKNINGLLATVFCKIKKQNNIIFSFYITNYERQLRKSFEFPYKTFKYVASNIFI